MEQFEQCLKELGIVETHAYHHSTSQQDCCSTSGNKSDHPKPSFKTSKGKGEGSKGKPRQLKKNACSLSTEDTSNPAKTLPAHSTSVKANPCKMVAKVNTVCEGTTNNMGVTYAATYLESNENISKEATSKPYVCNVCNRQFASKSTLTTHARIHSGEKPFTCNVCHRSFAHKSTLNEHANLHSDGPGPYQCTVCLRRFKQRKSLRAHRCEEETQEEAYQCEVCGRNFINRKALALHRIHHLADSSGNKEPKEKNFLCDVCARGFSNKYLLKAHQMTHVSSEDKNFVCTVCNKRFAHKKTLQVHESSHNGNKGPYHCTFCTKTFRYVANLDAHERVHTGQKPFECDICGAAFRQKSSLREHVVTHQETNEKPAFLCDICDRTFQVSRRQFVAHRYSHKNQTLRCSTCKKRFYNAEKLAAHLAFHDVPVSAQHSKISTVTAHVNEAGELVITQEANELRDGALIITPSLLQVLPSTDDDSGSVPTSVESQDNNKQWSFEVVIDSTE